MVVHSGTQAIRRNLVTGIRQIAARAQWEHYPGCLSRSCWCVVIECQTAHATQGHTTMPMKKPLIIAAGIAFSFIGFAVAIVFLSRTGIVSVAAAKLMLAALLGLYFGFGVLIAVYRLIGKLE